MTARTGTPGSPRKGFTIIELLVVIAIIGLLASIILASLNSARKRARDARRYADLAQIANALEMYYDDHNSYPVTTPVPASYQSIITSTVIYWSVCPGGGSRDTQGPNGYIPDLAPQYIPQLPTDPSGCGSGVYGGYIYTGNATDYKIAADWMGEVGEQCQLGKRFADADLRVSATPPGPGQFFCTLYTPGGHLW